MRIRCQVVLLAAIIAVAVLSGCYRPMKFDADPSVGTGAPLPIATTTTEFGVRTIRLQYGLPGRSAAPMLIGFQQIAITDDAGRPCTNISTNWGKAADYWASISFTPPAEAKAITASFTLSLDNVDYPLTARLTRIDAMHWRVDYGIK